MDDMQRAAEELARTASGGLQEAARGGSGALPAVEARDTMWRRPDDPSLPRRCRFCSTTRRR